MATEIIQFTCNYIAHFKLKKFLWTSRDFQVCLKYIFFLIDKIHKIMILKKLRKTKRRTQGYVETGSALLTDSITIRLKF